MLAFQCGTPILQQMKSSLHVSPTQFHDMQSVIKCVMFLIARNITYVATNKTKM
jgi:hypothetical protein